MKRETPAQPAKPARAAGPEKRGKREAPAKSIKKEAPAPSAAKKAPPKKIVKAPKKKAPSPRASRRAGRFVPQRRRGIPETALRPAAVRIGSILRGLDRLYPGADCALTHRNPLELLVATILSAQCTDERVNIVTRDLFTRYRTARDFAAANPVTLEGEIRSTGFFRNKTKSLLGMGRLLDERHGGVVPRTMDELLELPGVARKTANVVLGTAYGIPSGIVVDTHVSRLSQRLGLSRHADPVKIEAELMELVPRDRWIILSHQLIQHGRRICTARKPRCADCALRDYCPSADLTS